MLCARWWLCFFGESCVRYLSARPSERAAIKNYTIGAALPNVVCKTPMVKRFVSVFLDAVRVGLDSLFVRGYFGEEVGCCEDIA